MNYITIYLFKVKVIIGTSNACGVFRKTPREGGWLAMTARTHLEAVFSERRACGKVFLTAYRASHLRKVIMTTKTLTRLIIARDVGTAGT
jgi:hypothetical protein